jgi:Fe-S-cluster-containing dehydrogenase component
MQCADPPCVGVCPTGASHVNDDGIVLVDAETCIACGACIAACPYGARYFDERGFVGKCTFCEHRIAENRLPACVETCPTLCRSFGDLDDPNSDVNLAIRAAHRVEVLKPEQGTHPKLVYLNAPARFGLTREGVLR